MLACEQTLLKVMTLLRVKKLLIMTLYFVFLLDLLHSEPFLFLFSIFLALCAS